MIVCLVLFLSNVIKGCIACIVIVSNVSIVSISWYSR